MLIVQKYGGATLATPEKIKQVALRISKLTQTGTKVVAVVSAMGQTTNQLIDLAQQVSKKPSLRELDMLLSVGERMSMALLTMALNDLDCPAISFTGSQAGILTDNSHINANIIDVKGFRVSEALKENKIVILAGFQGVCPMTKEITTLGRGGSDTTAVAMAAYLNADHCEILKDVDCIYSADPKLIPDVKSINELNYDQLLGMTLWGAKVLHYKSVSMAKSKNIKLYVGPAHPINTIKNSLSVTNTEARTGTWILNNEPNNPNYCFSNDDKKSNFILSVNSHSEVLLINITENKLVTDLQLYEIGYPLILEIKSDSILLTGPSEILVAIKNKYSSVLKIFSSVSLTTQFPINLNFKNDILYFLKSKSICYIDYIENSHNLNLIVKSEDRLSVIQHLHSLT